MTAILIALALLSIVLTTALEEVKASDGTGSWKFVVFGDTRGSGANDTSGISPVLPVLAHGITSENASLVIHVGDLITGYMDNPPTTGDYYDQEYANWKEAVKPIYDFKNGSGTFIYTVRGNHEAGVNGNQNASVEAYDENIGVFMPQNGLIGQEGLTYSFVYKGVKFIALDQYQGVNQDDMGVVDLEWLDQQLTTDARQLTFVWSHTPAFGNNGSIPEMFRHVQARDAFWNSLTSNGGGSLLLRPRS